MNIITVHKNHMKILVVPLAGGEGLGPLTRCLAIIQEASVREHDVAILCKKDFGKLVTQYGFTFFEAPSPKPSGIELPPYRLCDVAIELGWVENSYFEKAIETERKAMQVFKPDVIFTETQLSIPISAKIEGIPWAASTGWADHPKFSSPLYPNHDPVRDYERKINKILSKYHLSPIDDICELAFLRADLKIAATTPQLQPELSIVPDVHFVGYLLSPDMEEGKLPKEIEKWGHDRKIIYVYMSPGDIIPDQWISIITNAFKDSEFNVMVTLSPLALTPDELPNIPNVKFVTTLPGSTAIRSSDLVITHGGGNTVTNALLQGKPLMIFSHFYAERDYNGRAVERLGAGINFRTEEFTSSSLLSHTKKMLSDKSYQTNSIKVGTAMKKFGGSKRAVDLLEKLGQNDKLH